MLASVLLAAPVPAGSAPEKTEPLVVFRTDGYASEPVLVADPALRVHLLFMTNQSRTPDPTTPGALMYARLERGSWTRPRNVLVSPSGGAVSQPAAALDGRGFLHVVFKAGLFNQIYYSNAHVTEADVAGGWAPTQTLSDQSSGPGAFGAAADVAVGQDGTVHVVYSGRDGNIHYRRSTTGGASWSSPSTVVDTSTTDTAADDPRVFVDSQGRANVTWTQVQRPIGWPPAGIFSSRSGDGGQNWTQPARIAGPNYSLVTTIAGPNRLLFRTWHSVAGLGEDRYQWSSDGGDSWSPAEKLAPPWRGAGLTGYAAAGFDAAGIVHLVVPSPSPQQGMYYLQSDGTAWSQPAYLSRGATGDVSLEFPALAIAGGNDLHVVYEEDFQRIWYTRRLLNAPGLPPQPIPAPEPAPVVEPTVPPAPAAIPAGLPQAQPTEQPPAPRIPPAGAPTPASAAMPGGPLAAGALSSILLLVAVLVVRRIAVKKP